VRARILTLIEILSDFGVIYIDKDDEINCERYKNVKKTIIPINFQDSIDYEIFCEIATILCDEITIKFYTNDKEFKNKIEKAFSKLVQEMGYNSSWMNLNYVE